MKHLIVIAVFLLSTMPAQATASTIIPAPQIVAAYHRGYNNGYNNGKESGKSQAYHNVAKTVFITAVVVAVGTMIYHLGKESRWTTNEKGVVYKF